MLLRQSPPCVFSLRDVRPGLSLKAKEISMQETTKYNGWSNYETWLASVWVGGTEAGYAALQRAYLAGDTTTEQAEWLKMQY